MSLSNSRAGQAGDSPEHGRFSRPAIPTLARAIPKRGAEPSPRTSTPAAPNSAFSFVSFATEPVEDSRVLSAPSLQRNIFEGGTERTSPDRHDSILSAHVGALQLREALQPPPTPTRAKETTSTSNSRNKIRTACDFCRTRKLKCDGQVKCYNCRERNKECTYTPSLPKKPSGESSTVKKHHAKRRRNEDDEQGDDYREQSPSVQAANRMKKRRAARSVAGPSGTRPMMDLFSSFQAENSIRTPEGPTRPVHPVTYHSGDWHLANSVRDHTLTHAAPRFGNTNFAVQIGLDVSCPSPEQSFGTILDVAGPEADPLVEKLLSVFLANIGMAPLPFTMQWFKTNCRSPNANLSLVQAVCSLMCLVPGVENELQSVGFVGNKWALCNSFFSEAIKSLCATSGVTTVQTLVILSMRHSYMGDLGAAHDLAVRAVRICADLGLHKSTTTVSGDAIAYNIFDRNVGETAFWSAFVHESFLAAALGNAPAIKPSDIEVKPPSGSLEGVGNLGPSIGLFDDLIRAHSTKLSLIIAESAQVITQVNWSPANPVEIASIVDKLQEWHSQVPPEVDVKRRRVASLTMHLSYHAAVIQALKGFVHIAQIAHPHKPSAVIAPWEMVKAASNSIHSILKRMKKIAKPGENFLHPAVFLALEASSTVHVLGLQTVDFLLNEIFLSDCLKFLEGAGKAQRCAAACSAAVKRALRCVGRDDLAQSVCEALALTDLPAEAQAQPAAHRFDDILDLFNEEEMPSAFVSPPSPGDMFSAFVDFSPLGPSAMPTTPKQ